MTYIASISCMPRQWLLVYSNRRLFPALVLQQLEYLPLDMNSAKASDLDELLDQKRRVPLGGFPDLC